MREKIKPREYAIDFFKEVHKLKVEIYIITSRGKNDLFSPLKETKKWLQDNDIYYDKLIIGNSNKLEECIKHKIDVFVDDKEKHCKKVNDYGIKTFIFDNRYNKNSNLIRVYNFNDLLSVIKKLV